MKIDEIGSKIQKLPDRLVPEVLDYIDFLINKYGAEKSDKKQDGKNFKFDWEGGLSKLKNEYTSVELQHKASDWR